MVIFNLPYLRGLRWINSTVVRRSSARVRSHNRNCLPPISDLRVSPHRFGRLNLSLTNKPCSRVMVTSSYNLDRPPFPFNCRLQSKLMIVFKTVWKVYNQRGTPVGNPYNFDWNRCWLTKTRPSNPLKIFQSFLEKNTVSILKKYSVHRIDVFSSVWVILR